MKIYYCSLIAYETNKILEPFKEEKIVLILKIGKKVNKMKNTSAVLDMHFKITSFPSSKFSIEHLTGPVQNLRCP